MATGTLIFGRGSSEEHRPIVYVPIVPIVPIVLRARVTGLASDELEAATRAGTFDTHKAADILSKSLEGKWRVQATPRANQPGVFDIKGERLP